LRDPTEILKDVPTIESRLSRQKLSYYLLGKKIYFILNSNAKSGNVSSIIKNLSKSFPLYSFNIILSSATKVATELTRDILSKDSLFIVMGGDGTINNAVQYLVNSPATFGLIPKGTANDLATYFGIPTNIKKALKLISRGITTRLDTVKVNAHHLLTIGSIGFPSLVADTVNKFKAGGMVQRFFHQYIFRSGIYKIFAFGLLLLKGSTVARHRGRITIDENPFYEGDFVAVFFGKQSFLGKSFCPLPRMKHSDPYLMISVLKFTNLRQLLKDMYQLGAGGSERVANLLIGSGQSFSIETEKFQHLLADGEILDFDDEFCGKRVPQAVQLLVPPTLSKFSEVSE